MLTFFEFTKAVDNSPLKLNFFEGGCSLMSVLISLGLFSPGNFNVKTLALTSALQSRHPTLVFFFIKGRIQ